MNNGLPLALGAVALLAAAGRMKRGSAAVALPYAARPMGGGLYEVVEVRTGARPRSGDGSYEEDDRHEIERIAERRNRQALLGRLSRVGPSADWVNDAWALSGGRVLFEDDDGDLLVLRRHGDDDESEIEELARYRTVAEAAAALGLGASLGSAATTGRAKRGSSSRAQQIDLTLVKDWPYAPLLSLLEEKARLDARMTGMFPDWDEEIRQSVETVEREIADWTYTHDAPDAWTARWEDGRLTREIEVVLRMDLTPLETRELLRQRRGAR